MLVLSRKIGEEFRVPQCGLVFTLLENQGQKIRIGFYGFAVASYRGANISVISHPLHVRVGRSKRSRQNERATGA